MSKFFLFYFFFICILLPSILLIATKTAIFSFFFLRFIFIHWTPYKMGILIFFYRFIFTFLYFSVILSTCLLLIFWLSYTYFIRFFCSFLLFLLFIALITFLLYSYNIFIIFFSYLPLLFPLLGLYINLIKFLNPKNCLLIFFLCMFILKTLFNSPKFANFTALKC